jgi:polar amino acid transport system substrate-binding protein
MIFHGRYGEQINDAQRWFADIGGIMRMLRFCSVLFFAVMTGCASVPDRPSPAVLRELAPTGKLRVGVVTSVTKGAYFVELDAAGRPQGATVELGTVLAGKLGVPVDFLVAPNSGVVTEALAAGAIDVTFMPVDEQRRKQVDFGPAYYFAEYAGIKTLADVDDPKVRAIGITNTTAIRAAGALLKRNKITGVNSIEEAAETIRAGKAHAFALSHGTLRQLVLQIPGTRVLDESFGRVVGAIAVQKNRPNALAYVTDFLENAKASGVVRRAFDNAGATTMDVAPPSPRK